MAFKSLCVFILIFLSGCSLLGERQWAAYQITVSVTDPAGFPISNARLESNEVKSQMTDSAGNANLQFRASGLHVVTITHNQYVTKQIKVLIPRDDAKIFSASLQLKK